MEAEVTSRLVERRGQKHKFFHAKASQRKRINAVKKIVLGHTREVFESSRGNVDLQWDKYMPHISGRLLVDSLNALTTPFSALEVKEAMFQMNPTKAPGPDGFSAIFYQKFWGSIGHEITRVTLKMLNEANIEEGINDTIITLIPKTKYASKVEHFRPISLCNVSSKLITKVLVRRLKLVLPEVISEFQGAFIPCRLITDNFILAHELGHFIKSGNARKSGYMSLKTGMSKAYDRVEWDFIYGSYSAKYGFTGFLG